MTSSKDTSLIEDAPDMAHQRAYLLLSLRSIQYMANTLCISDSKEAERVGKEIHAEIKKARKYCGVRP